MKSPPTLIRLARWSDWSTSKLPYLGAAALLLTPVEVTAGRVAAMLGTVVLWAAFGYAINDVADRDCDRRAGKENRAEGVPAVQWAVFLAVGAGGSVALAFTWAPDIAAPMLAGGGLLLATLYSLPPVRLKERGALGLVAGAASQWVLPVLALAAVQPRGWFRPEAWCVALLGLSIGVRWMAIHQLQDLDADRRAGVQTYASMGGGVWPLLVGAFVMEIVLLIAVLMLTWPRSLVAGAALLFWIGQELLLRPRGESFAEKLRGYDHAPLAEYYFLLLPVVLAGDRAITSPWFLALAAAFLAIGWDYVAMMSGEWYDEWRAKQVPT